MIYFNGTDAASWECFIKPIFYKANILIPQGIYQYSKVEYLCEYLCEDFLCFLDKLKVTSCDETEYRMHLNGDK